MKDMMGGLERDKNPMGKVAQPWLPREVKDSIRSKEETYNVAKKNTIPDVTGSTGGRGAYGSEGRCCSPPPIADPSIRSAEIQFCSTSPGTGLGPGVLERVTLRQGWYQLSHIVAKSKSKSILVQMASAAGTGFCFNAKRSRLREKLVLRKHDPIVNKHVLFFEKKKIRSI
uniref:large ribosomal subunit protein bL33m n=1 Tax=Pristiophorus japonicus TaxID=55135 RepID=UPI00398F57B6